MATVGVNATVDEELVRRVDAFSTQRYEAIAQGERGETAAVLEDAVAALSGEAQNT